MTLTVSDLRRYETLALLAQSHKQHIQDNLAFQARVHALNKVLAEIKTGKYDLGKREQAVINLYARAKNVCRTTRQSIGDRLKELNRINGELANVLAAHNKNALRSVPTQLIDNLR